MIFSFAKK